MLLPFFPGCLIIKVCHSAGTELWLWELHTPLLCRVVQDWLRKMLWGWPFICPRYHDTWELRLSYPNSAVFADTVVPFRWLHDGIARASRSRVAFLRQSGSFLFPSYCLREAKNGRWHRWSHEVKTKMTRFDKMPSRWPYEGQNGHTNSTLKWTFARSFGNFLACQRFCHRSRSCCQSLWNSTGGHTMA
jgi:hypothetical protein